MIVEGQVHGGIAQGVGQALYEGAVYDKDGQLVTGSFMDYAMPRADYLPSLKVDTTMTRCPSNPLGIKGCGEAGAIAAPAAVINAITDAIGTEQIAMPATPAAVWAALKKSRASCRTRHETRNKRRTAMYAFTFHRPQTVRQAAGLLTKNEDAKLLAGGQTLLPTMKLRLAGPPQIVDMTLIEGLSGIELSGRAITIGAMTTHYDVNTSPVVQQAAPVLAKLAGMIGDPAVRHRGTIGGSVANNDPERRLSGCLPRARRHHRHQQAPHQGRRFLHRHVLDRAGADRDHHQGEFPDAEEGGLSEIPQSGLALRAGRRVRAKRGSEIRVAVTGAGSNGVFRVKSFEEALKKRFSPKSLEGLTIPADGMNADIHGSAEYRAHLVGVLGAPRGRRGDRQVGRPNRPTIGPVCRARSDIRPAGQNLRR